MNKAKIKNLTGGLIQFLPLIFLGVAGVVLFNWIKKSGGIKSLVGGLLGIGNNENPETKKTGEQAFVLVQDALKRQRLTPNVLHTTQANAIFAIFNAEQSLAIWDLFKTALSEEQSKQIYDIYNGVKFTADDALIYSQYGRRKAFNRTSDALGFLWDDTTGDIRQHAAKYMHSAYKTKMIALIDRAIDAYLI